MVNTKQEWVLGGFETCTLIENSESRHQYNYIDQVPSYHKNPPPEEKATTKIDSWFFGQLLKDILKQVKIPAKLGRLSNELQLKNPKSRMDIAEFLKSDIFGNSELVAIANELPAYMDQHKFEMFCDRLENVQINSNKGFPLEYVHEKIVPGLVVHWNSGLVGVKPIMTITKLAKDMKEDKFKEFVLPILLETLNSNKKDLKAALLKTMPQYIENLDKQTVTDKFYPVIVGGYKDDDVEIRELTVKSTLSFAPKLYDRQLNGDLLRQLAKTQNDAKENVRVTTTKVLCGIAQYLSQSTRVSVLIAAFGRALKDTSVLSKIEALKALATLESHFGPEEICGKILGTVAPALIDRDMSVRREAAKTMEVFMGKINAYIKSLEDGDSKGSESSFLSFGLGSVTASKVTPSAFVQESVEKLSIKGSPSSNSSTSTRFKNPSLNVNTQTFGSTSSRRPLAPKPEPGSEPDEAEGWDDEWDEF